MSTRAGANISILVLRLSSLGDIVLTGPVYANLKNHWPDCKISVLVKPAYVPALEGNPNVDKVIPFYGLLDALKRIRSGSFTHCLDLHATFRSLVLRKFSGIPNCLRYHKDALARRLWVAIGWRSPALARHTIDRYLECLSAWGVPTPRRAVTLGDYRSESEDASRIHRVLIVQTAFLGDATLTVPLARALKRALPDCRLTILCRYDTEQLYGSAPWVDETLPDFKSGGLAGLWKLSRSLKARGFDLAIVPHRSLRSALAVWWAGIPRRVGFSASAGSFLFTRTIPFTWGMHDLERNLALLLPFSAPIEPCGDSVYLNPPRTGAAAEAVARRLAESGIGPQTRLVGIHPGSVWPTKRWPQERYASLIRRLAAEAGVRAVLIGGPGDAELCASIAQTAQTPVLDWSGRTDLSQLIALMPRLSLFVTNDSGPMHVAAGSGVPTLAVFGPTTRELGFFPYGPQHRVLEVDLNCRPCGLHGSRTCPAGHFLCMRLISVDQVFREAAEMLSQARTPSEALGRA